MVATWWIRLAGILQRMRIVVGCIRTGPGIRARAEIQNAASEAVAAGIPRSLIRGEVAYSRGTGRRPTRQSSMTNAE